MKKTYCSKLIFLFLTLVLVSFSVSAQYFDSQKYYRLTTQWQGEDKSLDILNDGKNNQPILADTGNFTGQMWKIKRTGRGIYTLSTKWQGENKVLDCIQGENQNLPILNQETGYSGGAWRITAVDDGYYRITNMWLNDRSLDIINDGYNNKIQIGKTGNFTGQFWKITEIKGLTKNSLNAGETLNAVSPTFSDSDILISANRQYMLRLQQEDGNLCIYRYENGKQGGFVWCSMVSGFSNGVLTMQRDGNLVVSDGNKKPLWSSKTHPFFNNKFANYKNKPVKLVLENNGSLKLYTAAGVSVWSNK